ncbi:tyrosine-type recombinase/integrase [Salinivibrio kushneri]|uniref:tyrosine-type recombinase/integrase n=1 Tax=Salinivibrio kushneri TaxID=1908198 RepID=UPI000985DC1D|nr:tyrosine-type recombinase/integrase [Salinivibrio kushneri]OOE52422.1 integrase [Salinivibrio kushneri]OOE59298.1 integrase [Salinivibrio kushneri]
MKRLLPLDTNDIEESQARFNTGTLSIEEWSSVTQNVYSQNSLLSYRNDWRVFVAFCQEQNVTPLPCAVTTLRRFAEITASRRKISAVRRMVITVGLVHKLHQFKDPSKHREVKYAMARLLHAKLPESREATPFQSHHLAALNQQLASSKRLKDIRDRLVWSLSYEGLLKRSELAALSVDDLITVEAQAFIMVRDQRVPLSESVARLLMDWLDKTGIRQGPLLRRINKHGQLGEAPLDPSSIYRVFRRASALLDESVTFSGQSPRVGASRSLAKKGMTIKQIQHMGRWKSPAMPAQYVGNTEASEQAKSRYRRKKLTD